MDSVDPYELLTRTICRRKHSALRALFMTHSKSTSSHLLSQASCLNNNHNRKVKHNILQKTMVNYPVSLLSLLDKSASFPLWVPTTTSKRQQWKCLCSVLGLHCLSPSVHTAYVRLKQMHCWFLSSSLLKSVNRSHLPNMCTPRIPLVTPSRPPMPCYLWLIFVICHCLRCDGFFPYQPSQKWGDH